MKKKLKLMAAGNHHIGGPSFASMMAQQQQQLYRWWWCTDEWHIMMAYIHISSSNKQQVYNYNNMHQQLYMQWPCCCDEMVCADG